MDFSQVSVFDLSFTDDSNIRLTPESWRDMIGKKYKMNFGMI